jgi:hypothetical protein
VSDDAPILGLQILAGREHSFSPTASKTSQLQIIDLQLLEINMSGFSGVDPATVIPADVRMISGCQGECVGTAIFGLIVLSLSLS